MLMTGQKLQTMFHKRTCTPLIQIQIQYISGAPHEAFQQHVNVHVPQIHHVQCLRVLARPLSLVHNDF